MKTELDQRGGSQRSPDTLQGVDILGDPHLSVPAALGGAPPPKAQVCQGARHLLRLEGGGHVSVRVGPVRRITWGQNIQTDKDHHVTNLAPAGDQGTRGLCSVAVVPDTAAACRWCSRWTGRSRTRPPRAPPRCLRSGGSPSPAWPGWRPVRGSCRSCAA